jgi:hypothetical protein
VVYVGVTTLIVIMSLTLFTGNCTEVSYSNHFSLNVKMVDMKYINN